MASGGLAAAGSGILFTPQRTSLWMSAIITGSGTSYLFDTVRRRLQMQTGKPVALGTSSSTHRWPPLRRGRRHHGGSMSESCLGALAPDEGGSLRRNECGAH